MAVLGNFKFTEFIKLSILTEGMSYTKRALRGAAKLFIFSLFASLLAYLLRILLARNLSVVEYGLFYSVLALFALLSVFQHMGLADALIKYIAEFKVKRMFSKIKSAVYFVFLFQLATALILGLLGILFADFLAVNYFHNESAAVVVKLLAVSVMLSPLELIFISIFFGFQRYFYFLNFLRMLFILLSTYIFLVLGFSIKAPIFAYILFYIVPPIFYYPLFIRRLFPDFNKIRMKFDPGLYKKIVAFGIPVIFTSVSAMVISYTDTLTITFFRGLKEAAFYNAAAPTARMLWIFGETLMMIVMPLSSELWIKNKKYLKEGIELVYRYAFIIVLPLALVLFSFPELTLRLLFGEEFQTASKALRILAISAVVLTVGNINNSVFSGIGRPRVASMIVFSAAMLNLILNIILVPLYGIVGAASSTLIAFALILMLSILKLKKIIKFKAPWRHWLNITLAGLIFLLALAVLKKLITADFLLEAVVSIVISGIVYLISLFLLRIISISELREIMRRIL